MRNIFCLLLALMTANAVNAGVITTMDFETGYDPTFNISGLYGRTDAVGTNGYNVLSTYTSSNYVGYTYGQAGSEVKFTSVTENFDLLELSMIGAWGSQTATLIGYQGAVAAYTQDVSINRFSVDNLLLGWSDLTAFSFVTGNDYVNQPGHTCCGGASTMQIAFDNIVIERGAIQAVPEPSALALLGLGLAGLARISHEEGSMRKEEAA